MKNETTEAHVYRPVMAGVMAGFIATLLNMFYDIGFRESTGFQLSDFINVATIIFATMLVLMAAGAIFAVMDRFIPHVQTIFIIVFVIITLLLVRMALHTHRSDDPLLTSQFRELLLGIVIISGSCASFLIPYFAKHNNIFI